MREIFQIHINGVAFASFFNYNDLEVYARANNLPDSAIMESFYC